MSVERHPRRRLAFATLGLVLMPVATAVAQPATAASGNIVSASTDRFSLEFDPLHVRPHVLDQGARLPGDVGPVACPTSLPAKQPLSLADAVDLALCNSPQVQGAWAAIKLQAALLGQSQAAWLPTINLSGSHMRSRTTYPAVPSSDSAQDGNTAYASLAWRLFDFGARAADNRAAARLLDAALASDDAVLQKTLGTVVQSYFDAVTARAAVSARREATAYAQQTYDATQRRENRGAAPVGDTLQAAAATAKARLAEQRAKGDYGKSLSVLAYACGLPMDSVIVLAEEPEPEQAQAVTDLANWLATAQESHPAIVAARAQVAAAEAKVDVARAQGLPSIDLSGNYYRNGYPNQGLQQTRSATTTVGVTLTIPLFEGFARSYQIRAAQAQVDQSRAQLQDTQLQILAAIVKDHADASASLVNLESSANWLKAAEAAVGSSRRLYDKGAGDVLELLAAQSSLADAQQERVRCLAEWRSARLRLFADSGTLGRKDIGAP